MSGSDRRPDDTADGGRHDGDERGTRSDVVTRAFDEVRARHDFFADWFAGRIDGERLEEAMTAFAPDFRHVGPGGVETDRRQLRDMLSSRHGSTPADFAIGVEELRVVIERPDAVVVTYVEVQTGGEPSTRVSTAVFELDAQTPLGVAWRHVQETWRQPHDKEERT